MPPSFEPAKHQPWGRKEPTMEILPSMPLESMAAKSEFVQDDDATHPFPKGDMLVLGMTQM